MATSSANPSDLAVFVKDAGAATATLATDVKSSTGTIDAFLNAPCDGRFRPAGSAEALHQATTLVTDNQTDEQWIDGIRKAFIAADSTTLSDGALAQSLKTAGIDTSAPTAMTADEPVYQGAVMYSGWSDDPVATATGHFHEVEVDLVMPERLGLLGWTRTYSSRFMRHHPVGRGWASLASLRLDVRADHVIYQGPDGQEAVYVAGATGFARPPGMDADLAADQDERGGVEGFTLTWSWTGRYPGLRWRFDPDGRIRQLQDPFGGTITASHDATGRLARLIHDGGRWLDLVWQGHHLVAVVADDGRQVRYHHAGDDLIGVDRPAGAQHLAVDDGGRIVELHDADGVRLVRNTYDDAGRVLTQESPFGRITSYEYLVPHTLVVSAGDGSSTLFRHDAAGRLVQLQLADGSRLSRRFDERGNPVEVVGLDGGLTRRTFDVRGNCTREVDPAGGVTERVFDELGRVTRTVDASGRWTELEYGDGDHLPSLTREPLGAETRFEVIGGLIVSATDADGVTVRFTHDGDGQVVSSTDGAGHTTTMRRSPAGTLTEVVSPLGRRTAMEVDGAGRLLALVEPGGGRWTLERSPAGRIVARTDPSGATVTATYGDHGELIALTDPTGATSRLSWDSNGRVTLMQTPEGGDWSYDHDDADRLRAVTDPTGQTWEMARSPEGFFAGVVDPLGHGTTSQFDAMGRQTAVTLPDGAHLDLTWDGAGRLLTGACAEQDSSCRLIYDESGRPVEAWLDGRPVSRSTYTAAGRPQSMTRPDGATWRWRYDGTGRMVEASSPEGSTTFTYDADGDLVSTVDPDGVTSEQEWDIDGRIVSSTVAGVRTVLDHDASGRVVARRTGPDDRRYDYDPRGLVRSVTDVLGAVTRFEHDAGALLRTVVAADGGRWEIERDACGRHTATVDPLGRRTSLDLDAAGRATSLTHPDGTRVAYRWSPGGELDAVTVDGRTVEEIRRVPSARQVTVRQADDVTTVEFDEGGRLSAIANGDDRTTWAWADDGRAVTALAPSGRATHTELDADGRPIRINADGLPPIRLERDSAGRVTAVAADGLARRWSRDGAGTLTGYDEQIGGQLRQTRFAYDDGGRLTGVTDTSDPGGHHFGYDAAGQLTAWDGPAGSWTWSYDEAGRLSSEAGPDGSRRFRYDAAGQLSEWDGPAGTTTVDHDQRGRRVAERGPAGSVTYRWDDRDRLIGVDRPGASRTFRYDPLGPLSAVDGRAVAWPVCGPIGPSLGGGVGPETVVGLDGLPIGTITGDSTTWLATDWQGTVGAHSPWGATDQAHDAGPGYLGALQVDDLVWLRHRVYDPANHSFLSRDPLPGDAGRPGGGTAGYGYAYNAPLQWLDPLGTKPMTADQAGAQMHAWRQGHLKEVLITAGALVVIVGVGVLTCGVGDVALGTFAGSVLIGAGASGGTTALSDYLHTGHVDWGQVTMDAAVGGAIGAFAPGLPAPMALSSRVAIGAGYGGAGAATATALDQYGTGQGFHPLDDLESGGIGAVTGGIFHAAHWTDELKPNQMRNFQKYLDTSKSAPDPNDPDTWTRQWQNRYHRLDPAADHTTNTRGGIASTVTPPTVAGAIPAGDGGSAPGTTPGNAPHAAPRAHVSPPTVMGGVAAP